MHKRLRREMEGETVLNHIPSRVTGATRGVVLGALLLSFQPIILRAEGPETPGDDAVAWSLLNAMKVYRSPSGRIAVVGQHSGGNLTVGKWADDVLARFEDQSHLECPVTLRDPFVIRVTPTDTNMPPSAGAVAPGEPFLVHRPFDVDYALADAGLCSSLLDACVRARDTRASDVPCAAPPAWLSVGLSRLLYPQRRSDDAGLVLRAWEQARLPSLMACLALPEEQTDAVVRAAWGLFLSYRLVLPDSRAFMNDALDTLAAGQELDAKWVRRASFNGGDGASAEAWWDGVVIKQRRVVRSPGRMRAEDRRRFEAALLLYPGAFGMPLSRALYDPVPWSRLIEDRDQHWVAEFCRKKQVFLRVLSVGRGALLQETAAAYADFLQALAAGKSERRLRKLLARAEAALDRLRQAPLE